MPRKGCFFSSRAGGHINKPTRAAVDYDKLATPEMALLLSFFRWYP